MSMQRKTFDVEVESDFNVPTSVEMDISGTVYLRMGYPKDVEYLFKFGRSHDLRMLAKALVYAAKMMEACGK